jgi:hypothetical protein
MPRELGAGLIRYLRYGIRPGGFLQAILRNDLADAARRADGVNFIRLGTYVIVLDVAAPADAWGTPEKVEAWIERGRRELGPRAPR